MPIKVERVYPPLLRCFIVLTCYSSQTGHTNDAGNTRGAQRGSQPDIWTAEEVGKTRAS